MTLALLCGAVIYTEPLPIVELPIEVDGRKHVLSLDSDESVTLTVERFGKGPGSGLSSKDLLVIRQAAHLKIEKKLRESLHHLNHQRGDYGNTSMSSLEAWTGILVTSTLSKPGIPDHLKTFLLGSALDWKYQLSKEFSTNSSIPKIIHHIWWQGKEHMERRARQGERLGIRGSPDWRAQFIPRWVSSWKRYHSNGWTHQLWNESTILTLARKEFGGIFYKLINSFSERIKKIDAARYLILLRYGGTVVDVDFECFRSIEKLFFGVEVLLSEEASSGSVNCALMSSRPFHPLWWYILHEIMWRHQKDPNRGVMHQTGPKMLTYAVRWWLDNVGEQGIKLLRHSRGETEIFYPFNDDDITSEFGAQNREVMSSQCCVANTCAEKYPQSYAMHHFAATWYDEYADQLGLQK